MADVTQVDSADIQVPIETGVVNTTPFPYYVGMPGGSATIMHSWVSCVYNGYLYVVLGYENPPSGTYHNAGGRVYRLNTDNLSGPWEYVAGPCYTNPPVACRFAFSLDGRYLFALFPAITTGSYQSERTAILDLDNSGAGFQTSAIPDFSRAFYYNLAGSSSTPGYEKHGAARTIVSKTAVHVLGGRSPEGKHINSNFKILLKNMSGNSWANDTLSPIGHSYCCSVYDPEMDCIYLAGGEKTETDSTSGSASTEVLRFDCSTSTWTRNALPALPLFSYHKQSQLVGRKWYIINGNGTMGSWYIDLDNPSEWVGIFPSPKDCHIMAWDQTHNRILAFMGTGNDSSNRSMQVLNLKPDQSPDGVWTQLNVGNVEIVQAAFADVPDVPFEITSNVLDRQQTENIDVPFAIGSYGYRISSHTSTYVNTITFAIQSAANGLTGATEADIPDILFSIVSNAVELLPPSIITFTIQSAATGSASVQESQTGTVDIPVVVTTYGQAATGVIGTASIKAIDRWYFGGAIAATNIIGTGECDITVDVGMLYESQNGAIGATGSGAATVLFSLARAFGAMSESHGGAVIVPPTTVDGWTVNLATGGHTQFTNWQFNSLFELNGQRYACNDTGLFRLGGNRDGDTVIDGCVISGVTDFGTMKLKYINSAYVHLRTDGDVAFRMVADEQRNRSGYHISFDGRQGIHRRRRKLAKGVKGTVWQAEMRNVDGADMEVAKVELLLAKSKRAIG